MSRDQLIDQSVMSIQSLQHKRSYFFDDVTRKIGPLDFTAGKICFKIYWHLFLSNLAGSDFDPVSSK